MNVSSNNANATIISESQKTRESQEYLRNAHLRQANAKQSPINDNINTKNESEKSAEIRLEKIRRSALIDRVILGVCGVITGIAFVGYGVNVGAKEKCLEQLTPMESQRGVGGTGAIAPDAEDALFGYLIGGLGLILAAGSSYAALNSTVELSKESYKRQKN